MKTRKTARKTADNTRLDREEIERFDALAADWWNPEGAMAPLHAMNPTRLEWLVGQLNKHFNSINKKQILDVGCGGGLTAEPLARLGASVTGIDGAEDLIRVARTHAAAENLRVTYRCALTNELIAENKIFDAVLALEVIEHVPDPALLIAEIAALVKPGGLVLLSTLNRTPASFAKGIVAAEYLLRWLPAGTHSWKKFVKPSELFALCTAHGLTPIETCGLTYDPLAKKFALDARNLDVNYFMAAVKGNAE